MEHVRLSKNMSDNWVQDSLISQKGKNDKKKKKKTWSDEFWACHIPAG